jgi:hypothetical protein
MCHYRRHLKGGLLSVYEFALATAKPPDRIFCASVATTCDATGYHHKTVSVALRELTKAGWLAKEERNRLLANSGTFQPNWYQVIDHDQRAVDHPEECRPTDRGVVLPPRQKTATVKPASTVVQKHSTTVMTKPTHIVRKNSKKEQREMSCAEREASCFTLIFEGRVLEITQRQDLILGELFPWIDRVSEYRKLDQWWVAHPKCAPSDGFYSLVFDWMARIPPPQPNPAKAA